MSKLFSSTVVKEQDEGIPQCTNLIKKALKSTLNNNRPGKRTGPSGRDCGECGLYLESIMARVAH